MKRILQTICCIPQRIILCIMGFLALVNAYMMRICLNVAIVEMAHKKEGKEGFEWSEELQGVILSSFFWGYFVMHIPGGVMAEKFGGKYLLSLGILSTAIFTLLTPITISYGGSHALIILRFLEGVGEGTTFPALSALLAIWVPLKERSKLGSFVYGGGQVGAICGMSISGLIIEAFDTWESVFYFFGISGVLWFIFFELMCFKDPESHPYIKDEEKEYLRQEMGRLTRDKDIGPTPWKGILSNAPFLSLIGTQIGHDFGFYIMATDLPKYMSDVLGYSISENGMLSSLPFLVMWISSILMGIVCDWMINKGWINVTNSRKLYTTIGTFFPAFLLIAASYAGFERGLVVTLFTLAMGTMAGFYPGMKVNVLDLSPNFASVLMGITNGIGALTGILGPYLVGVMTPNTTLEEWRGVFWMTFVVFHVTNIFYIIFASGEVQEFNDVKS